MVTKSDIGRNRMAVAKQATEARRAAQQQPGAVRKTPQQMRQAQKVADANRKAPMPPMRQFPEGTPPQKEALGRVRTNKAIQQQRNVSKMTPAQARLQLTQQAQRRTMTGTPVKAAKGTLVKKQAKKK